MLESTTCHNRRAFNFAFYTHKGVKGRWSWPFYSIIHVCVTTQLLGISQPGWEANQLQISYVSLMVVFQMAMFYAMLPTTAKTMALQVCYSMQLLMMFFAVSVATLKFFKHYTT